MLSSTRSPSSSIRSASPSNGTIARRSNRRRLANGGGPGQAKPCARRRSPSSGRIDLAGEQLVVATLFHATSPVKDDELAVVCCRHLYRCCTRRTRGCQLSL